ncbi:MAG: PBP1A family penicillin-binding protein [Rhodobacteraceae bacterium]|nr:PBP1A family penicillin-binding protein [Paracoccaceae bacterium]
MFARDLPNHEQLARYDPPTISRIFSAEGKLIDEFANERRLFSPVEEIPALVKHAFISAEDKNFYHHPGYDPVGIGKALLQALQGSRLRGASTITQQVMKNFLLSGTRSVERKIKEVLLAIRIEQTLSKDEILELFLNQIFLGQNSYGVTAAAQTYFNKPVEALAIEEVAYLAALPKAPSRYHPVRNREAAIARRNFVINEMVENGYASREAGKAAKQLGLKTVMSGDFVSFRSQRPPRGYFTDEIRRELSGTFGENSFFSEGLNIRATMDEELQAVAARALRTGLESYDRERAGKWLGTGLRLSAEILSDEPAWRAELSGLQLPRDIPGWRRGVILKIDEGGASVGVEGGAYSDIGFIPNSDVEWASAPEGGNAKSVRQLLAPGDVVFVERVSAGSGDAQEWSLRQIPEVQGAFMAMDVQSGRVLAMQGGFSYEQSVFNRATQATRQPGSAFKPFVYAAALDSGSTPATIIIDAPIEFETPEGLWQPKNSSDKFYGPVPLRTGIEMSRNLMTVRLAKDVGMSTIAGYAETFGIYDHMEPLLANALGAQETTLFKLVAAYAMFANGGERVYPTLVDRVQDRRGKTIYRHDRSLCVDCDRPNLVAGTVPQILNHRMRVMDPVTAYQLTSMLEGVVIRGTARYTVRPGIPVAGKTGTTNESRDAWFIGFTPEIVAGCYIGFDTPRSLGRRAYGSNLCGPVFNEFMKEAARKFGHIRFEVPDGGVFVAIDGSTGELLSDATASANEHAIIEYFRLGSEPRPGVTRVVDGGFAMASDLEIVEEDDSPDSDASAVSIDDSAESGELPRSSLGSISSGGLY